MDSVSTSTGNSTSYSKSGSIEQAKLSRFFSKLLDEATQLGCEHLNFKCEGESLSASLIKNGTEVKSVSLKSLWFEPIVRWLAERSDPFSTKRLIVTNLSEGSGECLVRIGAAKLARFDVTLKRGLKGIRKIELSSLKMLGTDAILEPLKLSSYSKSALDSITRSEQGLILVAAPEPVGIDRAVSLMLALTPAVNLAGVDLGQQREIITKLAATELVIVGVRSVDSIDAILKLRELGYDYGKIDLVGALTLGFVQQVCKACARETIIDSTQLEHLPEVIKPHKGATYLVGRGCEQCSATGYGGWIALENVVCVDDPIKNILKNGAEHKALLEILYERGLTSILEDGVRKALAKLTTLESVFKVARVMPDIYLRHLTTRLNSKSSSMVAEAPIAVQDGFFIKEGADSTSAQLSTPKQIFRAGSVEGGADQNSPLFSVSRLGKVREKSTILVVEDDKDQREILDLVFRTANYDVVLAVDGMDALEKLKGEVPDLVITDLMMPRMDGVQLVKQLKAHPVYKQLPILVLTVLSDSDKEYELLDLGADDYCEKTVQRKILLKRVEKVLAR